MTNKALGQVLTQLIPSEFDYCEIFSDTKVSGHSNKEPIALPILNDCPIISA